MSTCANQGPFGGPLTCDRLDPHDAPRGCTFTATHGADLSGEVGSDDE